jgi:hypothetical protein
VSEGALISAASLRLTFFFGSIISHVRSYQIQQCSYLLEQGPSGSMTTMDNRVGEGQGGVAATYCIDYGVVLCSMFAEYSRVHHGTRLPTRPPSTNLD